MQSVPCGKMHFTHSLCHILKAAFLKEGSAWIQNESWSQWRGCKFLGGGNQGTDVWSWNALSCVATCLSSWSVGWGKRSIRAHLKTSWSWVMATWYADLAAEVVMALSDKRAWHIKLFASFNSGTVDAAVLRVFGSAGKDETNWP